MQLTQGTAELFIHNLPPLNQHANTPLEGFMIEVLGKIIGPLFFYVDFQQSDLTIVHMMAPEEVPIHQKVLGAVGNLVLRGKEECSVIVLEDATPDSGFELGRKSKSFDDLTKHGSQWKKGAHGSAQCRVFRFKCRQRNLRLQLRLSGDGTSSKGDDISGPRLGTCWRIVGIAAMEASKVRVNITINREISGWANNGAFSARLS
jgi:hypothetical protein